MKYDVIILGAGASGLMTAISALSRKKSVLILDHEMQIGRKIRVSGGGRCNFTNLNAGLSNYVSENPKFCLSALARYTPFDFLSLVQKHKVMYKEKKKGQLFCEKSSLDLITLLESETQKATFQMNTRVQKVSHSKEGFSIETNRGVFEGKSFVVATGGLSYPKLGATNIGYLIAEQFGHEIVPPRPALDALILDEKEFFKNLAGVSMFCGVSVGKQSFVDDILFTHKGLSGPAILQISSYWTKGQALEIDFSPEKNIFELLKTQKKKSSNLAQALTLLFPRAFVESVIDSKTLQKPLIAFKDSDLEKLAASFHHWKINPIKTQGYDTAEVTRGGVSTSDINSQTLESKKVSGLFFVGEVLDITGHLGGYNLQWAWSSGFVAGQNV